MRYQTKVKLCLLVVSFFIVDGMNFVADEIRQLRHEYTVEVAELTADLSEMHRLRDEEKTSYEEVLMGIVNDLYATDQYWIGGFDDTTLEGSIVEAAYSAIKNRTMNYREMLEEMGNYFNARNTYLRDIPSIWPIEYNELTRITSGYGFRLSPITGKLGFHGSLDIAGARNANIIVPADGVVIETYPAPNGYWKGHSKFGGFVKVRHAYEFETWYAHMSEVAVSKGQILEQGDKIGTMGDTGQSKGPHLHYTVWRYGELVNPLDYLRV